MANRIKTLREHHGYTQERVAQLINVSRQAYGMYERNQRSPDIAVLLSLADIYNVSLDYLCGRSSIPDKPISLRREEELILECYKKFNATNQRLLYNLLCNLYENTTFN
ncbi:MAG: helix-turn-helix domain-containing protein [Lachnospiraceae bacterium]